jgi:hypothetical protein
VSPASYYGQPVLKEPAWEWMVPAYFFCGGLAAASSGLGLGARLAGLGRLGRVARLTSALGIAAGAGLLVADLGRPARFHHMLRVLKPTSPMSVGSWVLAGFGPAAAGCAVGELTGRAPRATAACELAAAGLAPLLATYTAVVVADTSVPAWRRGRRELPFAFAAGALASAGGWAAAWVPAHEAGPARRLAVLGGLGELGALAAVRHRLGPAGRGGRARLLERGSDATVAAGLALVLAGRVRPGLARLGGALVAAGTALARLAVFEAGVASTRDPALAAGP